MAEWTKAQHWKCCVAKVTVGSNPTPTANFHFRYNIKLMFFRQNREQEYIPPSVEEESRKVLSGQIKIIGTVIFFAVVLSNNFSNQLDNLIPFGRFLWIFFILIFLFYIIKISSKIDKSLKIKNTSIALEYNKYGDSVLFDYATKNGTLGLFDSKKIILMCIIIPFSFLFLTFGILALHLAIFKKIGQFLPLGIITVIVSVGVAFLFLFEDKRILNEASRRNQFIDVAEKRWKISKIIYISIILFSLICAFILIKNNMNFLEKGVITSNRQTIYDGRY